MKTGYTHALLIFGLLLAWEYAVLIYNPEMDLIALIGSIIRVIIQVGMVTGASTATFFVKIYVYILCYWHGLISLMSAFWHSGFTWLTTFWSFLGDLVSYPLSAINGFLTVVCQGFECIGRQIFAFIEYWVDVPKLLLALGHLLIKLPIMCVIIPTAIILVPIKSFIETLESYQIVVPYPENFVNWMPIIGLIILFYEYNFERRRRR